MTAVVRFAEAPPRYIVGNWYLPFARGVLTGGAAAGANSIRLAPFRIEEAVTISDLACRVSTLFSGGLCQLAIYAVRPDSNLPGKCIGFTGSISTTLATTVSGDILGDNVRLQPGLYWFAVNSDNATVAYTMYGTTSSNMGSLIGSPTVTDVLEAAGSTSRPAVAIAQTFGTWPDLTNSTLTPQSNHAVGAFKVSATG